MPSIEPRTLKTLMNLRVLTMNMYPLLSGSFRFLQLCSGKVRPTKTETSRLYIPWLHPCGITHTHSSHTCFAPKKNITYPLFQHVEGQNKNRRTNGRSPRLPLTKGHPDLLRNPPPSSESSPAGESTMAPPTRFP